MDDIIDAADSVTGLAKPDTLYVIHAGTNDVQTTRLEDLVAKYQRVISKYKEKSQHILMSGILPRIKPYSGLSVEYIGLMVNCKNCVKMKESHSLTYGVTSMSVRICSEMTVYI